MGLGGGKGGRGGGGKGKGGKGGGKSLGGMLGGLPIVGGMFGGGGGYPGMGGKGMGGFPGMTGSSFNNMMNMFPGMLMNGLMGGMRGMGPMGVPPWMNMFQQPGQQQGQGQNLQNDAGFAKGQHGQQPQGQNQNPPTLNSTTYNGPQQQPQGGGNMPSLGAAPRSGSGGPVGFNLGNLSAPNTNPNYGGTRGSGTQAFGTFTGTPMAGGNQQMGFYDPRVNR